MGSLPQVTGSARALSVVCGKGREPQPDMQEWGQRLQLFKFNVLQ